MKIISIIFNKLLLNDSKKITFHKKVDFFLINAFNKLNIYQTHNKMENYQIYEFEIYMQFDSILLQLPTELILYLSKFMYFRSMIRFVLTCKFVVDII